MSSEAKIAIVNSSSFGRHFPEIKNSLMNLGQVKCFNVNPEISGNKLARRLKGFKYIIASITPIYDKVFFDNIGQELQLIVRHGGGYDNIDIDYATQNRVLITRVSRKHERDAVAELSLTLMLNCTRKIIPAQKAVNQGKWNERSKFLGREISKTNIGIIGCGSIGSRLTEILACGFGANIFIYDPYNKSFSDEQRNIKYYESLKKMLPKCDFVSLNASLNKTSYHIIDYNEFSLMKNDSILINTARGDLINEDALIRTLKRDKIGAVGLDVCKTEPINKDNPLMNFDNVIIIPHIGGYTNFSLKNMDKKMLEDIEALEAGEIPDEIVNEEVVEFIFN